MHTNINITFPDGYVVRTATPPSTSVFYKTQKGVRKPAENVGLKDQDDDEGIPGTYNNFPDPRDNHGAQGMNMGFLDGHVVFVLRSKDIFRAYMGGHYHTSVDNTLQLSYGLQFSGSTYTWIAP